MSQSTRLENFRWTPEGARFEAGGRAVDLRSQEHPSALAAAQAFFQEALSAYPTGAVVAPERRSWMPDWMRPSHWTQKVRSLFARVLSHATGLPYPPAVGGGKTATAQASPNEAAEESNAAAPAPAKERAKPGPKAPSFSAGTTPAQASPSEPVEEGAGITPPPVKERAGSAPKGPSVTTVGGRPQTSPNDSIEGASGAETMAVKRRMTSAPSAPDARPDQAASSATPSKAPSIRPDERSGPLRGARDVQGEREVGFQREATEADGPLLRAAYADSAGVHVIWADRGDGRKLRETELLYSFDSPVAAKLQDCYRGLAGLGYDVVDLRVWRKEAEVAKEISPAAPAPTAPSPGARSPAAPSTAVSSPSIPVAPPAAAPSPAAKPAAEKPDAAQIMRLHPEPGDTPGRAIVSPVGDDTRLQVLTAPEKLVDALHAAADPKRPAEDRVTHLRCATSRGSLKVVAVGMGENKEDPGAPGRWENISTWWEQAKKTMQAAVPATPMPTPAAVAGSKAGPDPELF